MDLCYNEYARGEQPETIRQPETGRRYKMKCTVKFGKINARGTGKRYAAEVTIELRERGGEKTYTVQNGEKVYTGNTTPVYTELSICGTVWNQPHTDCIMGGQCLDDMYPYLKYNALFREIHELWKKYHLNGMHAGTPEQEKAVEQWKQNTGKRYDYTEVCEYLKSIRLYEVMFTGCTVGRRYNNEPYKYGHGWVIQELPGDVLLRIEHIIDTVNSHNQ